jgi:hypothetical protein
MVEQASRAEVHHKSGEKHSEQVQAHETASRLGADAHGTSSSAMQERARVAGATQEMVKNGQLPPCDIHEARHALAKPCGGGEQTTSTNHRSEGSPENRSVGVGTSPAKATEHERAESQKAKNDTGAHPQEHPQEHSKEHPQHAQHHKKHHGEHHPKPHHHHKNHHGHNASTEGDHSSKGTTSTRHQANEGGRADAHTEEQHASENAKNGAKPGEATGLAGSKGTKPQESGQIF